MTKIVVWKDVNDLDNYLLGTLRPDGESPAIAWAMIFIDGIYEIFGEKIADKMKDAKAGEIYEITFSKVKIRRHK